MIHKNNILKLRLDGKSYKQIRKELGCSLSTISFHCSTPESKKKYEKKEKIIKKGFLKCNPKKKKIRLNFEEFINQWKNKEITGGKGDKTGHGCVSHHIRKYLFKKYDNKCSKCKWSEFNPFTNTIPLEVEHIDGNPMNHVEENLILLCPNCHSLTMGHNTSKGNGRRYYREKYRKEVGAVRVELT